MCDSDAFSAEIHGDIVSLMLHWMGCASRLCPLLRVSIHYFQQCWLYENILGLAGGVYLLLTNFEVFYTRHYLIMGFISVGSDCMGYAALSTSWYKPRTGSS